MPKRFNPLKREKILDEAVRNVRWRWPVELKALIKGGLSSFLSDIIIREVRAEFARLTAAPSDD